MLTGKNWRRWKSKYWILWNNNKKIISISILALLLTTFIIVIKDNKLEDFENLHQIQGYFQTYKKEGVVPYWWCLGSDNYQNYIKKHEVVTYIAPFKDPEIVYYAKSAEKAAIKLIDSVSTEITKIEKWQDYATGVHALVDIQNSKGQYTLEIKDNQATEIEIFLPDRKVRTSKVWFVTTTYLRPVNFNRYLESLTSLYNSGEKNFGVCLGLYYKEDGSIEELQSIENFKIGKEEITIITNKNKLPFKKAPTLQQCINDDRINENDILFMVDVDVTFDDNVIDRIKRYVVQGSRVYNPIIWYRDRDENGQHYPKNPTGYAYGGIGIVAIYKSDVLKFGGYDTVTFQDQHGFEDTDFFFRIKYSKLQIVRTLERNIEHWPHSRDTWQKQNYRNVNVLCPL